MVDVQSAAALINGLRTEFVDIYDKLRIAQADSRLATVMENVGATNRTHPFAWWDAAPHMQYWPMGDAIPVDTFRAHKYDVPVHNFGIALEWLKWNRRDDQTQYLYQHARQAATSAALSEERIFFDVLNNVSTSATTYLPGVPNAADGVAMFSTTDAASAARFGATNGNKLTGNGITTVYDIQTDFFNAIVQFGLFKDGHGQPLISPSIIDQGVMVIHSSADEQVMSYAFDWMRQPMGVSTTGAPSATATITAAVASTNILKDRQFNIDRWSSNRLATGDWYVFLKGAPTKPTFLLERQSLEIHEAMAEDNVSDEGRRTGKESIQFEIRQGGAPTLPYGAIMIDNS